MRAALVAAVLALATSAQAQPATSPSSQGSAYAGIVTVDVFANSTMLITPVRSDHYKLAVYRMDGMDLFRQRINQQIPRGGEAQARAWLIANAGRIKSEARPIAAQAANSMNLAHYYRLDRLPAVVINRKTVVYGVTDVEAAIARYQASRRRR